MRLPVFIPTTESARPQRKSTFINEILKVKQTLHLTISYAIISIRE